MKTVNVFVIARSENRNSRRGMGTNGCGNTVPSSGTLKIYFISDFFSPFNSDFIKRLDFGFLVNAVDNNTSVEINKRITLTNRIF